ncbi:MAG: hypothetical protein IJM34_03400 [Lachnospiraceae bacterium]|nr:hypothetical protein [Lachnospiraceae bacterium]
MSELKKKGKVRLTAVSIYHYVRLIGRSVIFLVLLYLYIMYRLQNGEDIGTLIESHPVILSVIWMIFLIEMILRFFPSKIESPGCQKQFARNYIKTGKTEIRIQDDNAVMLVALIWIAFNAVFGMLHMKGILDDGIMMLLCSFYSVCDLICILFFCPFQSWLLKNKCCCTCRIYNWDYAMMFTPLFFVQKTYTWSLLVLSVALLARWEITFYRYPERFSENTNGYLNCANCTEKLCTHKKQLNSLWKKIALYMQERVKKLKL